jgi:signal transduction histidine kinase/ActR/RegA family two-component response regulator
VPAAPQAASQLLIGGIALAFMLFLVTRAQVRAWETALRHEQELRQSALALHESESQARAANRAKDEFLATLSHELRTPLNVVLGWVNMLRHGNVGEERVPHALEMIERNARQQAALIEDLLDVSRIVTGKLRLELQPVALAPIVSAVVESLRPSADAKGVEIGGPAPGRDFAVLGDADRLRQATWNLLSNAIKFTPSGGHVQAELTRDAHHVRLTVRDDGIGIAPEFLPHVFERFRQADSSTTREHTGVGLGLAITRHLVELHGGTVEAQSEGRDRGARFVITLRAAAEEATPVAASERSSVPARTPLSGIRVLVVDDDPATLEMLSAQLGMTGAEVRAADSARRALERFRIEGADVIVSDIAMPGEDGLWLMKRIRELPGAHGRTPAIALTALARAEDRHRAFDAGYQMHLAKPVEWDELQTGLATLVSEHGAK